MKMRMTCGTIIAAALAAAATVANGGDASPFDDYIGSGPGKVPGAVVIGCVDGKITTHCFGHADVAAKKPMTADTVGWLASNTKAIACALVLSYVEEGKLGLDELISRYLPEWQGDKVPTLRQCMSHTSGLKFFPEMPIDRRPVQLLSRIGAKSERVAAPGEKYQYSNWGIDVAVACVEVVAGQPWEVLLKERILDPLDMHDATFFPTEEQCARLAKGYVLTDDNPAKEVTVNQLQYPYSLHSRYPEAGGGLFGSPMDMIKFFAMVANGGVGLNGKRVLKAETVAMWFEKQTPECVSEDYSFGAKVAKDKQMMSHGGAWSTWGCAYRESGVARVFFVQYAGGGSKGYKEFRSLVDKDAETSYSPTAGDTGQVDGVAIEETCRAFDPSNGWTRVDYVLRPTTDSFIRCRLILPPEERWTGRFWGLGNGSEGGNVWHVPSYARRGDASVHCDLGTSEGRLYRCPAAFDDFGWRATHLMTVTGKALTERFYGSKIKRSYFRGGSTGGNQGMREAMDFPEDYDGIAVDVPAQARVSMCALYWWIGRQIRDEAGNVVVSSNQCAAIARAALDWFSDKDELYARGKFLTDPRYSPEAEEGIYALASKSCAELVLPGMRERWHKIFTGPVINGRRAHAGFPFGADLSGLTRRFNYNLAWLVGRDCDQRTVSPETIEAYARRFGPQVNAEKEDLSAFAARGGKLLVMPGLEDEYVPYTSALDWYERTAERMGGLDRLREFCRLFLLPGRAHGQGRGMGEAHDVANVIVDWVEKGIAPELLHADDYPIAAYPDKIGGDAVSGWCVKPFGRLGFPRADPLYVHGREEPSSGSANPDDMGMRGQRGCCELDLANGCPRGNNNMKGL